MKTRKQFQRNTVTRPIQTYVEREQPPKVFTERNGSMVLMCPFCEIPHPVSAEIASPCGSLLRVTVVQNIYKSKYFPDMICAKCGEHGGEMTKFQDGFIHMVDCKPGVKVLNDPPFSRLAALAFKLKDGGWLKKWVIKNIGLPQAVHEIMPGGERTGNVKGYVFYRSEKK